MKTEPLSSRWISSFSGVLALFEATKAFDYFVPGGELILTGHLLGYLCLSVAILGSLFTYYTGQSFGRLALVCTLVIALIAECLETINLPSVPAEASVLPHWLSVISPFLLPAGIILTILLLVARGNHRVQT